MRAPAPHGLHHRAPAVQLRLGVDAGGVGVACREGAGVSIWAETWQVGSLSGQWGACAGSLCCRHKAITRCVRQPHSKAGRPCPTLLSPPCAV